MKKKNGTKLTEKKAPQHGDDDVIDLIKAMGMAVIVALVIRSFAFEPFNIPSGSLLPTLQIGDYLFVEKYAYGYSRYSFPMDMIPFQGRIFGGDPQRGDIAVFRQPKKTNVDYIKRVIGLPGDKVQVKKGVLHINGRPVMRDFRGMEEVEDNAHTTLYKRYIETLPNGVQHNIYEVSDNERFDNTPVYNVPAGYYFVMGDNRDSSLDSRATEEVGFIPAENLIGRAWFIFFSSEGIGNKCSGEEGILGSVACRVVEWPKALRYSRFFKVINKI